MDSMSTHLANLNFGHSYRPEKSYMTLSLDNNMKEEAFIGLELFFKFHRYVYINWDR